METAMRKKMATISGLVLGGLLVLASVPAWAVVTLRVSTNDAVPGGVATLTVSMESDAGESVASAQVDVTFATDQLGLEGACSGSEDPCTLNADCGANRCILDCVKDPRLGQQDFNATFPEFQNLPAGQRKARLRVLAPIQGQLPLPSFADGVIATCTLGVPGDAALGPISLAADRLEVGDAEGEALPAAVALEPGSIVGELPTPTPVPDTPTEAPTEEPTGTPTEVPSVVPTATMTMTLSLPPTATHTVTPPSQTPVTPATATAVVDTPTVGPTSPVATATRTSTVVPTPTQGGSGGDDDGCHIHPRGGNQIAPWWLGLPIGLLVGIRRIAR